MKIYKEDKVTASQPFATKILINNVESPKLMVGMHWHDYCEVLYIMDGEARQTIENRISVPVLSALGIFVFIANWDSFLWPLIVLDDISKKTLPLGLALFRQSFGMAKWNVIMAGAVVSILPVMAVFPAAQRNFIEGITLSGMKM